MLAASADHDYHDVSARHPDNGHGTAAHQRHLSTVGGNMICIEKLLVDVGLIHIEQCNNCDFTVSGSAPLPPFSAFSLKPT